MVLGFIAAALIAAASPTSTGNICTGLSQQLDRLVCSNAELLAWARAATSVQADLDAYHPDPHGVDANEWRGRLERCSDAGCVREVYSGWLEDLVYPEARPAFPIRKALTYRIGAGMVEARNTLKFRELGSDWALFILDGYAAPRAPNGSPFLGGGAFVVHLTHGAGQYRDSRGNGFDVAKKSYGWHVEQIGDCNCGSHVSLGGDYRQFGRRRN